VIPDDKIEYAANRNAMAVGCVSKAP